MVYPTIRRVSTQDPDPTSIFDNIEFRDAYRMSYLTNAVIVPTYEQVRLDFGVIRAEYHLLMCLAHYPTLTAQDVSRLTRRPRNSISRAVHRMLAEGYLERSPHPDDGRQALLTITPAGRELHDQISARLAARQEEILAPLSPAERRQLDRILQKLAVHTAALP